MIKTKSLTEKQLFGFNPAFLIYASTGIFDVLALAQGWKLLFTRVGVMLSALIFYLSATGETEEQISLMAERGIYIFSLVNLKLFQARFLWSPKKSQKRK